MKRLFVVSVVAILLVATLTYFQPQGGVIPLEEERANVYFVSPDEYLRTRLRDSYLWDLAGNVKLDTVLLPVAPEVLKDKTDPTSGGFVGAEACAECHLSYYESFVETSHFKTSAKPSQTTILGSFEPGKSLVETKSPNLSFEMLAKDNKFFQSARLRVRDKTYAGEFPFDLVTGSGKMGQTYCYWKDDHLFQLHISYLVDTDCWINSPGFVDGTASYARPIVARCLECHATYFQAVEGTRNQYRRDNYILGISCENCHGRGREHITYHHQHPDSTESYGIVNPADLSAERARDTCRLCHGGTADANSSQDGQLPVLPF